MFDSSVTMAAAAAKGAGVALVPVTMFREELETGRLKPAIPANRIARPLLVDLVEIPQ
jgi:LysR family transcriptional regulator of beta-lactamase